MGSNTINSGMPGYVPVSNLSQGPNPTGSPGPVPEGPAAVLQGLPQDVYSANGASGVPDPKALIASTLLSSGGSLAHFNNVANGLRTWKNTLPAFEDAKGVARGVLQAQGALSRLGARGTAAARAATDFLHVTGPVEGLANAVRGLFSGVRDLLGAGGQLERAGFGIGGAFRAFKWVKALPFVGGAVALAFDAKREWDFFHDGGTPAQKALGVLSMAGDVACMVPIPVAALVGAGVSMGANIVENHTGPVIN